MSTYVLMKILESAPMRYDRGIRILTLGGVDRAYDRLASHIKKGDTILDIGCGTGALSLRAAKAGAKVRGIDINPQMLEIAERRAKDQGLGKSVEFIEMGVAELGGEKDKYDVIMSGLCFSELTDDELNFTIREARRLLTPKGILLIADEVRPQNILKRILSFLFRLPLVVITYIITQTTTSAVKNLPNRIENAGFVIKSKGTNVLGNFIELVCENTEKAG
jgi:demethylmenaquinone methyltransferase/2-methoxy-6-polyprenyl-1,4-benzoquinol methylase